jgi:hypothetical protein
MLACAGYFASFALHTRAKKVYSKTGLVLAQELFVLYFAPDHVTDFNGHNSSNQEVAKGDSP